jgi:hypothetical protein
VSVAALPGILSHAGAITVEASLICNVSEIFHPPVTQEDTHRRTKVKMCCSDFVLGFCKSFSQAACMLL